MYVHVYCVSGSMHMSLADPGWAHPAPPPPNGRGPMIFYAQNAIFSQLFLASLANHFMRYFNRNVAQTAPKHA